MNYRKDGKAFMLVCGFRDINGVRYPCGNGGHCGDQLLVCGYAKKQLTGENKKDNNRITFEKE